MFMSKFSKNSDSLTQAPVEIPPVVLTECKRGDENNLADNGDDNATVTEWEPGQRSCSPSSPPPSPSSCHPESDEDDEDACNYEEFVYVVTIDGNPACFFNYRCRALKYMREKARELCMLSMPFIPMTYSVVRHHSEDHIDVVRRMNNVLISYDQTVRSFRLTRVYKHNM